MSIDEADASGSATVECPFCAEQISARAKKCRHCGETIDVALRKAEEALRATERSTGNVYMNAAAATAAQPVETGTKSRVVAIVLALFLGGLGVHKFYLGQPGWGLLYLLFCWTFIPAIIAFIEAILLLLTSDRDFHRKYG
jgi:TM2 domain-containing membrane protein YozV